MYFFGLGSIYLHTLLCLWLHTLDVVDGVDCAKSKQEWWRVRYTSMVGNMLLRTPFNADYGSSICPVHGHSSCCDHRTEREMYALGQRHVAHQATSNWLRIAEQMNNDSAALEYFFRTDLEQAKNRLHHFFSRIYGYNYKLHRRFFFQFFTDLEAYIVGQRSQLDHLVENFFSQLRDSIVSLMERSGQVRSGSQGFGLNRADGLNSNPSLGSTGGGSVDEAAEARRIRCLSDRVAQLRPFDDVDVRLKSRMLEAYPPARMLVNVLSATSRLLSHLTSQVSTRPECIIAMTRFQFCAVCVGKSLSSVCPEACPKLMSSCLLAEGPPNTQLSDVWSRLTDAIVMTTGRLERSSNFPAVNRHLQMEISEAITSLQTRYEQTKSKFESECHTGSGRSVPTLFSSAGSLSRSTHADSHPSQLSNWPPSSLVGFRRKRDLTARNQRQSSQSNPSVVSPELLDWQTRHRSSLSGSSRHPLKQNGYAEFGQDPKPFWDTSTSDSTPDVPDRLIRWATQLKHTYTTLGNMFAVPGISLCPSSMQHSGPNSTSNHSDCWNPPDIASASPDRGITEIVRLLSDATDRLHQVSSNGGDPDALIVQPMGSRSSPDSRDHTFNEPVHAPVAPRLDTSEQWNSQSHRGSFSPFDNRVDQNEALGSETDGDNWDGSPHTNQQLRSSPVSSQTQFGPARGQPIGTGSSESSGYGEHPPYQPYESSGGNQWFPPDDPRNAYEDMDSRLEATDSLGLQQSSVQETLRPMTPTSLHAPETLSTQPPSTTMLASTTLEPATTLERSEKSEPTTMATATTTEPSLVTSISATMSTELSKLLTPHWHSTGTLSTITQPTPVTQTSNHNFGSLVAQSPPFGGFPDDEDTMQQPKIDNVGHPSQLRTPSPSVVEQPPWSVASEPGHSQETWMESPYAPNGFSETHRDPNGSPGVPDQNYGIPPGHREMSVPDVPPFYSAVGSGQAPDLSAPRGMGTYEAAPTDDEFPYASPAGERASQSSWSDPPQPYPIFQGSGTPDDGASEWREPTPGSGAYEPSASPPTDMGPPRIPMTEPPPEPIITSAPISKPQPVLPHPFLPPPEIWVPAQIGPGQPLPSVLLVREYNVQGPFYSPDAMQSKDNRAVHGGFSPNLIVPLITLLYRMLPID